MKKMIFLIAIAMLFIGCEKSEPDFVNQNNETAEINVCDFFDLERVCLGSYSEILVDRNTDVLYYRYQKTGYHTNAICITAIMKADGSCLTLTEWKTIHHIK